MSPEGRAKLLVLGKLKAILAAHLAMLRAVQAFRMAAPRRAWNSWLNLEAARLATLQLAVLHAVRQVLIEPRLTTIASCCWLLLIFCYWCAGDFCCCSFLLLLHTRAAAHACCCTLSCQGQRGDEHGKRAYTRVLPPRLETLHAADLAEIVRASNARLHHILHSLFHPPLRILPPSSYRLISSPPLPSHTSVLLSLLPPFIPTHTPSHQLTHPHLLTHPHTYSHTLTPTHTPSPTHTP